LLRISLGCVYGIIGKPGQGAWALSYLLTDRVERYVGRVLANQTLVKSQCLESNSMYIGEHGPRFMREIAKYEREKLGKKQDRKGRIVRLFAFTFLLGDQLVVFTRILST
jgi:hypothetical protein